MLGLAGEGLALRPPPGPRWPGEKAGASVSAEIGGGQGAALGPKRAGHGGFLGLGWPGSGAETSEWASWRSCWLLFDRLEGQLRKPRVVIHMPAGQASSSLPSLESPRLSVSCGRWTLSWPAWITCPLLGMAQKATQLYSCVRPHSERPHCAGHCSYPQLVPPDPGA